ncbi:3-dehydroquinate synthase [Burkholderiaceae bacterium FT117]|uniref:3-dehydroquinate synthase n=1 Tax=Zeimonas sediminis TaxID=2944268 RepID=UPI002342FAE0|nr:3-dehydroquinate synthase [Zeimonas sediminis]MCM5569402.1 3-dehydroquinate synthase [Zeimonas sediminis]
MTIPLTSSEVGQQTVWQRFAVPFEFPVVFTENLFAPENPALRDAVARLEPARRHRLIVFVDDGLAASRPELVDQVQAYADHHAANLELVCKPVLVPGGEKIKADLHFIESIQQSLFDFHIDRHSYVVAIGGGAVLDAVGLVAATTHRGVRHIRIPTTVLAQNDSGVGVKNGVNLHGVKNFVGSFAPPFAVLNDIDFALSLPDRDKIAGMAEAVKVALIRDASFFRWLEQNSENLATFERGAMATMIRRCAELHMRQIAHGGDPFETGSARPLDYGHWSAHKLESITRHHVRHGEAVAIGMALDARYSVLSGLLEPGQEDRICALLEFLGFDLWHPGMLRTEPDGELTILAGLREFQEHLGGELTITLLGDIGTGVEVHEIDTERMKEALHWLQKRLEA